MDPFAAPPSNPTAGNPFGGQLQPDPYSSPGTMGSGQTGANPFGGMQQQQPQQQVQQQPPYGSPQQSQNSFQQQPPPQDHWQQVQQQQQPQPTQMPEQQSYQSIPPQNQQGYGFTQQQPQQHQALVPSQQQSNPYAIVQSPQQQNNQWSLGGQSAQPPSSPASYDPFAAPPAAPPVVSPPSPPQDQQHQAIVPSQQQSNPYAYPGAPAYSQQQQYQQIPHDYQQYQQPPQDFQQQQQYQQPPQDFQQQPPQPERHSPPPPRSRSPVHERSMVPAPSSGYPGSPPPKEQDTDPEARTPSGAAARNKYSSTLAQEAPLGASPLPRADMVRKTGYVLSRISFRTIVMKKWKQSFWVQYGPHTMLWFRSQSDFDDWLNNPYHTQAQRNFLIKLAVNFAHDLYKPNVRGYQVTQCRTKAYGTKMIRQFKLERWMDYGPTIAAAFGSNNPKEVDELREALVACMRNTPLNGQIRATGAVRERAEQGHEDGGERRSDGGHYDAASFSGHRNPRPTGNRSVASANDALNDDRGFDDANSLGNYPASAAPAPQPEVDLLDLSEPVQTQAPPQPYAQQQQQPQSPQMQPNPYPVQQQYAPPPQQQYQGGPPMQQQGQYPGSPPPGQPPYGANPQMQQQYPGQPPQPQVYGGF